jgi:type II secretion system protein N
MYGLFGLLVLLGLIVLLINLYLQSAGVQSKIQKSLSNAFDLPIEIQTVSYTPPRGLRLSSITIPPDSPDDPPFLKCASVTLRFRLSPLFRNRFVINEVVIHNPTMYWAQTERGKWQPPKDTAPPGKSESEPPFESSPSPETESPIAVQPVETTITGTEPAETPLFARAPRFEVQVKHFGVKEGTFDLRKNDDEPIVTFTGINIEGDISSKGIAVGNASSLQTRIVEKVLLESLTSDFKLSPDELELREVRADLGGGMLQGAFDFAPSKDDSPYDLTTEFSNVEVRRLLEEAGGPGSKVSGTLSGSLKLNGSTRDGSKTDGIGRLTLEDGTFEQYGILQFIGDNLHISELSKLELKEAYANFHVENGRIYVDDLFLKSPNLEIRAKGKINPDKKLRLHARLTINEQISRQLPGFIEDNFNEIKGSKQRFVDFEIGGTLDQPETDLVRLVLWKKQEETAVRLFRQIFGGK